MNAGLEVTHDMPDL